MSITETRPEARQRPRSLTTVAVLAAVAALALIPLFARLDDAPRAAVTFTNDSPWTISVSLIADDGSRVSLGNVGATSSKQVGELTRPSGAWTFEFSFGDRKVRRRYTTDRLDAADFHVPMPGGLLKTLERDQAPPSPY